MRHGFVERSLTRASKDVMLLSGTPLVRETETKRKRQRQREIDRQTERERDSERVTTAGSSDDSADDFRSSQAGAPLSPFHFTQFIIDSLLSFFQRLWQSGA